MTNLKMLININMLINLKVFINLKVGVICQLDPWLATRDSSAASRENSPTYP